MHEMSGVDREPARAVLFVNGRMTQYDRFADWVAGPGYRVGVNGGTQHCLRMGLMPDVVIGDLDSLPVPARQALQTAQVPLVEFPQAKDKTDLELALEHVMARDLHHIILLGMWGGRLDQSVANLLLLARYADMARMVLVTERETARVLCDGEDYRIQDCAGAVLSILPLTPQVEGVTLAGMEYPLANALLAFGTSLGLSNRVRAQEARVSLRRGRLLVVLSRLD